MDNIEWSDKFSVGVAVLDEQHQILVGMINKLIETPYQASNSAVIAESLDGMIQYAINHFETEEGLLRTHAYPDFQSQKEQHIEFIKRTAEYCKVEEGTVVVDNFSESLLMYLREWWVDHILIDDMKYKSFFADQGIS